MVDVTRPEELVENQTVTESISNGNDHLVLTESGVFKIIYKQDGSDYKTMEQLSSKFVPLDRVTHISVTDDKEAESRNWGDVAIIGTLGVLGVLAGVVEMAIAVIGAILLFMASMMFIVKIVTTESESVSKDESVVTVYFESASTEKDLNIIAPSGSEDVKAFIQTITGDLNSE